MASPDDIVNSGRSPTIGETLKRLATTFAVRDIMTPCAYLVCAPDDERAPLISANNPDFDVIPIRSGNVITGYFDKAVGSPKKLSLEDVISDGTNLLDFIDICARRPFSFVLGEQEIKGYAHFSDLNHHLVKLTFYVMLEALERRTLELIPRDDERAYLSRNLDALRFAQVEGAYRRAGRAARSLISYLNISDILRLAALAGRITIEEHIAKRIKDIRDDTSHAGEDLVSSYEGVMTLAKVKSECLRILDSLRGDRVNAAGA